MQIRVCLVAIENEYEAADLSELSQCGGMRGKRFRPGVAADAHSLRIDLQGRQKDVQDTLKHAFGRLALAQHVQRIAGSTV